VDLLEVASYIYAADSAISRGGKIDAQMGARWRRNFQFIIPVRMPDLWSSDPVSSALIETLTFLSDDGKYEVEYESLVDPPPSETYFEFDDIAGTAFKPDEVILFSGGMDSLAGAVQELAGGRKVALVSHRSASKIASAQKHLVDQLRDRFGADRLLHVPVWANLDGSLGNETTHRTRSFLFAALGAVAARLFGNDSIHVFENGIVSLNLPPVSQVVGARATRTTHPQAIAGLRRFLSKLLQRNFGVDNPFAWLTKAEVVEQISASASGDLIRYTRSCTRVYEMTRDHPHCGECSQCIDRRFAVLAAGQAHQDPAEAYKCDLFLGQRPAGPDREMALAYVRSASRIKKMDDVAFFTHYGETSRIVGHYPEPVDRVAERIFNLHHRHASAVCEVFDAMTGAHASALREGSLLADCLLSLVVGQRSDLTTYPRPAKEPERLTSLGSDIRISITEDQRRVVFEGWGEVRGESAKLLSTLAAPFQEATRDGVTPESFPFTSAANLLRQTECANEETLRRRVFRCRKAIAEIAKNAEAPPPSTDDVIENSQWHGYRLNPDRVRIVALSELRRGE
jgi:7-cyano-7-deazaguanine synthase in queuosine biosynthesis